jgi:hypothetical protein
VCRTEDLERYMPKAPKHLPQSYPNSLCAYIAVNQLDPKEVMNTLQSHGVISDNCISPEDVADSGKAVSFLNLRSEEGEW